MIEVRKDKEFDEAIKIALKGTGISGKQIANVFVRFGRDWSGDLSAYVDVVLDVKNEADWTYERYKAIEAQLENAAKKLMKEQVENVYFSFIDKTDLPHRFPQLVNA